MSPPPLPPSVPLRQNYSVQSLVSLLGDCAELEGLGSRFPTISGPLSSIWAVGSGPDGVRQSIDLSAPSSPCAELTDQMQPCRSETPPGGPSAFEASEKLRKCLAPRLVRSRCSSSAGPYPNPNPSPNHNQVRSRCSSSAGSSFVGGDTLRRAWAPQAMRPHGASSAGGSSM